MMGDGWKCRCPESHPSVGSAWKMPPPSSMSPLLLVTLVATAFSVAVSGAKVPSDSECYSAYNSIGQDAM